MFNVKTILHPTDFSPLSQNAYELACSMAVQHDARVILIHVAITAPAPAPMPYEAAAIHSEQLVDEAELRRKLEEMRAAKPNLTMDYVFECGEPSDIILRVSREADCDVIVMGTHGRSGLSRFLMGSVAEKVLREAPCPVVTMNEPKSQEPESPTEKAERASV